MGCGGSKTATPAPAPGLLKQDKTQKEAKSKAVSEDVVVAAPAIVADVEATIMPLGSDSNVANPAAEPPTKTLAEIVALIKTAGPAELEATLSEITLGNYVKLQEAMASFEESQVDSAMVPQTKLKELIVNSSTITKTKFVKNVPIAVYPLNVESLASMPSLILEGMGELDKATYPNKDAYLKANLGGAMALQVAHGKLDAYPIPADQYTSNYKAVSLEEMQQKNPKNATALSGILGDLSTIPGVCGALKTVPTEMVLASDLGFPLNNLLKIEAPWGGDQTKDAGKDAYLVVCDAPYLINLDELGLPVAYTTAVDAQKVCEEEPRNEAKQVDSQLVTTEAESLVEVPQRRVACCC
jgi:hypothetical protein